MALTGDRSELRPGVCEGDWGTSLWARALALHYAKREPTPTQPR